MLFKAFQTADSVRAAAILAVAMLSVSTQAFTPAACPGVTIGPICCSGTLLGPSGVIATIVSTTADAEVTPTTTPDAAAESHQPQVLRVRDGQFCRRAGESGGSSSSDSGSPVSSIVDGGPGAIQTTTTTATATATVSSIVDSSPGAGDFGTSSSSSLTLFPDVSGTHVIAPGTLTCVGAVVSISPPVPEGTPFPFGNASTIVPPGVGTAGASGSGGLVGLTSTGLSFVPTPTSIARASTTAPVPSASTAGAADAGLARSKELGALALGIVSFLYWLF